jgi:hypothetical protein
MRSVAKDFITKLVRLGGMNRWVHTIKSFQNHLK